MGDYIDEVGIENFYEHFWNIVQAKGLTYDDFKESDRGQDRHIYVEFESQSEHYTLQFLTSLHYHRFDKPQSALDCAWLRQDMVFYDIHNNDIFYHIPYHSAAMLNINEMFKNMSAGFLEELQAMFNKKNYIKTAELIIDEFVKDKNS